MVKLEEVAHVLPSTPLHKISVSGALGAAVSTPSMAGCCSRGEQVDRSLLN